MDSNFISTLVGAVATGAIAWIATKQINYTAKQNKRVEIANKWQIMAIDCFMTLEAIKQNYLHATTIDHPLERFLSIPVIALPLEPIQTKTYELSFLTPVTFDEHREAPWMSIIRISSMIKNYNIAMQTWQMRNEQYLQIRESLARHEITQTDEERIGAEKFITIIGEGKLLEHLRLTEKVIHLTDNLIIEIYDFIKSAHETFSQVVDLPEPERQSSIMQYLPPEDEHNGTLTTSKPINIKTLSKIFQIPEPLIKNRFNLDVKKPAEDNAITDPYKKNQVLYAARRKRFGSWIKKYL